MKIIFVDGPTQTAIKTEAGFCSFFVLTGLFGMIAFTVASAFAASYRDYWGLAGFMIMAGVCSVPVRMFLHEIWEKVLTLEHAHIVHPDEG